MSCEDRVSPTPPPAHVEREFEIGKDEAWFANVKRTYDEYQMESLESNRRSRLAFDALQNVALQAVQNAVENANMLAKQAFRHVENTNETANMTAKQASRHADLAIDRQWNVDEVAIAVTRSGTFRDAIAAAVAAAVNTALSDKK